MTFFGPQSLCKTRAVGRSENPEASSSSHRPFEEKCSLCSFSKSEGPPPHDSDGSKGQYVRKLAGYCKTGQSNNG